MTAGGNAAASEAKAAEALVPEDGTVVPDIEVTILEVSQMKYHVLYRAAVMDGNGVFAGGEELEILAEDEQQEILEEGKAYRVSLAYDSGREIPFRLLAGTVLQ